MFCHIVTWNKNIVNGTYGLFSASSKNSKLVFSIKQADFQDKLSPEADHRGKFLGHWDQQEPRNYDPNKSQLEI